MGKIGLFIFFGVLVYLVLTRNRRKLDVPVAPAVEAMIQCDYCRVHLPVSESLLVGGKYFCCEEHRRLGHR